MTWLLIAAVVLSLFFRVDLPDLVRLEKQARQREDT